MAEYRLDFPPDFEEWEPEVRGFYLGAVLTFAGKKYRLNFYDPANLSHEAEYFVQHEGLFSEPNVVCIDRLTRAGMEDAAARLVQRAEKGHPIDLVEETVTPKQGRTP